MPDGWVQVDAGLDRDARPARRSARLAFAALGSAVEAGRGRDVDRFFFQRKPPDLRLRFGTDDVDGTADWIAPTLDTLVRDHVLTTWHRARYEPEWRKLGGHAAMDAYHRWADADTRAWLAFDRWAGDHVPDAVDARATEDALVAALVGPLLDGLFVLTIGDRHEVWDAWCNLLELAGPGDVATPVGGPADLADAVGAAGAAMAGDLAHLAAANEELADRLNRALAAGESDTGLRATVALIAQLSLNRWGLDGPAQRALAGAYATARDPRSRLRGGAPPG